MKRFLTLLFSVILVFSSIGAQRTHRRSSPPAPPKTDCPQVYDITDCPETGCGSRYDPDLNRQKDRLDNSEQPTPRSFQWMNQLKSPPKANFCGGDKRDRSLLPEEGQKITVVAWALGARKGSKESCNCGLKLPKDTDNHIVLMDPALKNPTLDAEGDSQTAEFTPRIRLTHPNFTQENLEPLIDPDWAPGDTPSKGKLLVRVTGFLMFDSEHYCGRPVPKGRHNNWEIHPVSKMEYCPEGLTCTADTNENWKDLDTE
jgi:hypothetical protein